MVRIGQIGIALGTLGIVLAFMGLFPGVTGLAPTAGIGVIQLITLLAGFTLLILGALIYAKFTFYPTAPANFAQQIALRLSLTGLLFAALSASADIVGFGANPRTETSDIFFGPWQAAGLIGSFMVAALGVLLYALTGPEELPRPPGSDDDTLVHIPRPNKKPTDETEPRQPVK